eukprot:CAMPEP_0178996772 /NCGR_PEP_ID=MMETSP0795-20121207/8557_1 /TAXON_ID=88552 /ORGANISM="Amoebophrya sp., Strain Ameob2" /LENGTH=623 /DNA_ID=CAMNT_0020689205 /DNA_START=74 /DNA_END=1946 /DNA_ORIENTATION=-
MTASGTSTDAGASMDAGASAAADDHHEQNAIAELESLVWGVEGERYPISWEMQGLNASWLPEQLANGPCGVLAAYSAQLLRLRHESKSEEVAGADLRTAPLTPEMQAAGLAELLVRVLVQPLPCSVGANGNAPTTSPRRQHLQKMKSVVYLCTQLHPLPRFLQVEVDLVLDRAGLSVLRSAVRSAVEPHLAAFNGPAGGDSPRFSLVRTRGVKNVLLDAGANNLNLSIEGLIAAPFNLCTAELLSLFMRGTASPDFEHDCVQEPGSDALGAEASTSTTSPVCGLLTSLEIESGAPMAAAFKNPPAPIFILHGGDHYTLLWQENAGSAPDADSKSITSSGACSKMKKTFHFNGLPPAGPRLCTIDLRAPASLSTSSGAASSPSGSSNPNRNRYVKPEPGEIEDIVQSKKPAPSASSAPAPSSEDYTQWTYEVALALESPDVSASEQRDLAQDPIHKFELGEPPKSGPWRCRKCYETRFSTMCFGQNEIEPFVVKESVDAEVDAANLVYNKDLILTSTSCPAADVDAAGGAATTSTTTCSSAAGGSMKGANEQEEARCRHCGDLISVCGWTLWLGFAELPGRWRRRVRLRYGPKIMRVLETKWPDADLQAVDGKTRAEGWSLPSV